ncbi:toxin-activating lysine-acyltransferase [Marinobacterium sp. D7]|uniref:toxin-activating lysine-acyltransferase n=1 Tax=Marinobacterium ramblicola TaxID=2849041 RepID=UPI001C2DB2DD|nr:toxin-activating lysine-acyltransferase [Marinobacterium ramblicola]MBV1786781.1 toxin-activating lysine-acyltransferase [Marinobacterium ramblicola]
MTDKNADAALAALNDARGALSKLPILGPALWLYARDPMKKYLFMGDIDWVLLPPVVLDQCRLYTKEELPYAFFTWARVNDQIDSRLRTSHAKLAPHEWNCGEHVWIIDAVAPFGQLEETIKELRENIFPGLPVSALLPDPSKAGAVVVHDWPASEMKASC